MLLEEGSSFQGISQKLDTLRSWSEGFPGTREIQALYSEVIGHLDDMILQLNSEVAAFLPTELEDYSHDDLCKVVGNLGALKSAILEAEDLSVHCRKLPVDYEGFEATLIMLSDVLNLWHEDGSNMMESDGMDEDGLQVVVTRLSCLESLRTLLEEESLCDDLLKQTDTVKTELEGRAIMSFDEAYKELKESENSLSKWRLEQFKRVADLFGELKGPCGPQMMSRYVSLLDRIEATLKMMSNQFNLGDITTKGITNGASLGKALAHFEKCLWFDEFLESQSQYIGNVCIRIRNLCEDRVKLIQKRLQNKLDKLHDPWNDSCTVLKSLPSLFAELHEASEFGNAIGDANLSGSKSQAQAILKPYVNRLHDSTKSCLMEMESAVETWTPIGNLECLARKLNISLRETELLEKLDVSEFNSELKSIRSKTVELFDKFSENLILFLDSDGGYDEKAYYLEAVEKLGKFRCILPLLPNMSEIKEKTRLSISECARQVEIIVGETSKWDEIDALLGDLQKAVVLDPYTSSEATIRLRTLTQLREQKETRVDSELQDMIDNQDFKGMGGFIKPLAESTDQLKKTKFCRYRDQICTFLQARIDDTHAFLDLKISTENTQSIIKNLEILEDAKREIGKLVKEKLNLIPTIKALKARANRKLETKLASLDKAINEKDFEKLIEVRNEVGMLSRLPDRFLGFKVKKGLGESMANCQRLIDSVPSIVDEFVNFAFRTKGSDLYQVLSSLQRASVRKESIMEEMVVLHKETVTSLDTKLRKSLSALESTVLETGCHDDAIAALRSLDLQLKGGLGVYIQKDAIDEVQRKLSSWSTVDCLQMELSLSDVKGEVEMYETRLNKLSRRRFWDVWYSGRTYDNLCNQVHVRVNVYVSRAESALKHGDKCAFQECLDSLLLIDRKLGMHIKGSKARAQELGRKAKSSFLQVCEQIHGLLESENFAHDQFASLFLEYRSFVLRIASLVETGDTKKAFNLTHQLVFEKLEASILNLKDSLKFRLDSFDFFEIRSKVENVRSFGDFVADRFPLLREEIRSLRSEVLKFDNWLKKIDQLCFEHFSAGRDLSRLKFFARLEVAPSASMAEIKRAYHAKAKKCHPDKSGNFNRSKDSGADFRAVKEAWEELEKADQACQPSQSKPFDYLLREIEGVLLQKVREYLGEQRYEIVENLIYKLRGLRHLDDLASPNLAGRETQTAIFNLVKSHVEKSRVEVDSFWSERNYRALNEVIADLKLMEKYFKAHPDIFPTSWNSGIVESIESEISSVGKKAQECLRDKKFAKEREDEFRSLFIRMGFVLVELPSFKDFTKSTMCRVLESCLDSDWGYAYLFELGLSLQRGDENDSDDQNRIAQILVSEFSQFREVLTMVWNEETTQKPAEVTVNDLRGNRPSDPGKSLAIDKESLLNSFHVFESKYKLLLGEYIKPGADLTLLVDKTMAITKGFKSLRCTQGWDGDLKREIPNILAGVFALFTVIKSGESYNRIQMAAEASDLGEKLLMKPHNIQVLSLLHMLGCGSSSSGSLESQLMQIRTGEGKSVILGAAATTLGLLGFKVRCVCYSEYLSERDFRLFQDVFNYFGLVDLIKYSKITSLSEDTTAAKGDIRKLTESLLHQKVNAPAYSQGLAQLANGNDATTVEDRQGSEQLSSSTNEYTSLEEEGLQSIENDNNCISIEEEGSAIGKQRQTTKMQSRESVDGEASDASSESESIGHNEIDLDQESNGSSLIGDFNLSLQGKEVPNKPEGKNPDASMLVFAPNAREDPETELSPQMTAGLVSTAAADVKGRSQTAQDVEMTPVEKTHKTIPVKNGDSPSERRSKRIRLAEPLPSDRPVEEVLLVDEVDVFFGSEFYGQTYNQVVLLREPEIADILKDIWKASKSGGKRQRLADVKSLPAYNELLKTFPSFLLDNEIALMLDQVRKVDDEPYFLDVSRDRIGYKVMDSICYEVTYGYRTVFAYLNEADKGNLKNPDTTLGEVLAMPVSCGQFSYANINPARILGVSGTLEAMGDFEKDVLTKYGINTFVFVPSVYGQSNFMFDKAGEGICIESSTSDYFHKITSEIKDATAQKRAVIVFFQDNSRIKQYAASAFYPKLGRRKNLLTEDMSAEDKDFVIQKAATAGQVTICARVFGRGTDFFCKDERVETNGGVHVIQAFLSAEQSEEVQIQGRTARQGKKGSYQMVLLETDLEKDFGVQPGEKDNVAKKDCYDWLCQARDKRRLVYCQGIEDDLRKATEKDKKTHAYFDALLASNPQEATKLFKELYLAIKKRPAPSTIGVDLAFVVDTTGSMAPYSRAVPQIARSLLEGGSSILSKLTAKFPETAFTTRVAALGFRDIDDGNDQFCESDFNGDHFTEIMSDALAFIDTITKNSSGGVDLAEDCLGAIHRCTNWTNGLDWSGSIKCILFFTDAPAHGFVPPGISNVASVDNYFVRHPSGLTVDAVADELVSKDVDLFFCSFNPSITSMTEEKLAKQYLDHPDNSEEREIARIPLVQPRELSSLTEWAEQNTKHIIFVLDQSGSMSNDWSGVVVAYNQFIACRIQSQNPSDIISVVQFASSASVTVQQQPISTAPKKLQFKSGGTCFSPAAKSACEVARQTPSSHVPIVVFMSDGGTDTSDASRAASEFQNLNSALKSDLELHVIAFGRGADTNQLSQISRSSPIGILHLSSNTAQLSTIFVNIAGGQDVAGKLEKEIGKRVSDAVTDKLSIEYMA